MERPTDFEWDDVKAENNLAKHAVPFSVAITVFADRGHVVTDTVRDDDGEDRKKAVGTIQGRVFTAVFSSVCDIRWFCVQFSAARSSLTAGRP